MEIIQLVLVESRVQSPSINASATIGKILEPVFCGIWAEYLKHILLANTGVTAPLQGLQYLDGLQGGAQI